VTGSKNNRGVLVLAVHLLEVCVAAVGGGVVGALAHRVHTRQQLSLLQQRLLRSEEARNGAIERSAAAREQIGQLSKAISELRRAHQPTRATATPAAPRTAEDRRADAERALALAASGQLRTADGDEPPLVFANTEPMQY
jgi:hypothetical protein